MDKELFLELFKHMTPEEQERVIAEIKRKEDKENEKADL